MRTRAEEKRITTIMVDRNLIGRELEREKRDDEAIALYKANVHDLFGGSHPYWQLAVIYRRRKQYDDEIRVLEQALRIGVADSGSRKQA